MKRVVAFVLASFFLVRWQEVSWGEREGSAFAGPWFNYTEREKRFPTEPDAVRFARRAGSHVGTHRVKVLKVEKTETEIPWRPDAGGKDVPADDGRAK